MPIQCSGIGLHSGRLVTMTLRPASANAGVQFVRTDLAEPRQPIPARWDRVCDTQLCTVLANDDGVRVGTVEHLMAALAGCGIDNVTVEVDGPELPIMDGSAAPFVALIERAGIRALSAARRAIRILRRVEVEDGDCAVSLAPAAHASFGFEIEFASRAIARQEGFVPLVKSVFRDEVAEARTFGFLEDVQTLRRRGLALGGSLDNAVVVSGDHVLNADGLRFPDEFVRHKILDAIGDLYLAGAPILGHFQGRRSGHTANNRLLRALFADDMAWCFALTEGSASAAGGWMAGPMALSA